MLLYGLHLVLYANQIQHQHQMLRPSFRFILASVIAGALLGCATQAPPPVASTPDESRRLIEQAIARSTELPAGTANADARMPPAVMGQGGMYITYGGEGKDLLRRVAVARGLAFRVRGPQPHLPLFVIVDAKNVPFEEFLGDVGAQFGQRADLVLTNDAIEVRYRD